MFKGNCKKVAARLSLIPAAMAAQSAMAQEASGPIETMLEGISLGGVATAVAAIGLVLVAIALTFKGPDVAKRVIRKV